MEIFREFRISKKLKNPKSSSSHKKINLLQPKKRSNLFQLRILIRNKGTNQLNRFLKQLPSIDNHSMLLMTNNRKMLSIQPIRLSFWKIKSFLNHLAVLWFKKQFFKVKSILHPNASVFTLISIPVMFFLGEPLFKYLNTT